MFCSNKLPRIESRLDSLEYQTTTCIQELNKAFSASNSRIDKLDARLCAFADMWHPAMNCAIKDQMTTEANVIKELVETDIQALKKELKSDIRRLREELSKENKKSAFEIKQIREEMAVEIRLANEKTDTDMKRLRQHMESEMRSLREEMRGGNNESPASA